MSAAFAYHRGVAPLMWVLVALASAELVMTHALLAWWRPWLALVVSLMTLAGIGWIVRGIAAMKTRPVTVDAEAVLLRTGSIKALSVSPNGIARVRLGGWDAAEVKARTTLNLALVAWPNVMVDLDPPRIRRRRTVRSVAHRLDDPAGFAAAVEQARTAT